MITPTRRTALLSVLAMLTAGPLFGCKNDSNPSGSTAPAPLTSVVRPICESVGLSVRAGVLVGGNECLEGSTFNSDENCDFTPVTESFSGNCTDTQPDCGFSISTSASGSVTFLPEFDSTTGGLTAIRASGSVSTEFTGDFGNACGQTGNQVDAVVSISIEFEVIDNPVTVSLDGSLNLDSGGSIRPLFLLFSSDGFEIRFPESGQSLIDSRVYQPGTYTITLNLRANPEFNAGVSSGDFNLSLHFGQ